MANAKTHSPRFETVRGYFERGLWNESWVAKAVQCGWITSDEQAEIIGGDPKDKAE